MSIAVQELANTLIPVYMCIHVWILCIWSAVVSCGGKHLLYMTSAVLYCNLRGSCADLLCCAGLQCCRISIWLLYKRLTCCSDCMYLWTTGRSLKFSVETG